jgi:hypothetical protein
VQRTPAVRVFPKFSITTSVVDTGNQPATCEFIAGDNDTGGEFISGDNNTGGKFSTKVHLALLTLLFALKQKIKLYKYERSAKKIS